MRNSGTLQVSYPEIYNLIGVEQHPTRHPEGDVFNHTLQVCDWAQTIANRESLNDEDRLKLVFAALCHDFGKAAVKPSGEPVTYISDSGFPTAPQHAYYGIQPTADFLYRIGAPVEFVSVVSKLVEFHMHHINYKDNKPREKSLRKLKQSGVDLRLLMLLTNCDNNGRDGPNGERNYRYGVPDGMLNMLRAYLYWHMKEQVEKPEPAVITGMWLIQRGYNPSINRKKFVYKGNMIPAFGVILKHAENAQKNGTLTHQNADEWFDAAIRTNLFGFDPDVL